MKSKIVLGSLVGIMMFGFIENALAKTAVISRKIGIEVSIPTSWSTSESPTSITVRQDGSANKIKFKLLPAKGISDLSDLTEEFGEDTTTLGNRTGVVIQRTESAGKFVVLSTPGKILEIESANDTGHLSQEIIDQILDSIRVFPPSVGVSEP